MNKLNSKFDLHYLPKMFTKKFLFQIMCERSRSFYILSTVANFSQRKIKLILLVIPATLKSYNRNYWAIQTFTYSIKIWILLIFNFNCNLSANIVDHFW